MVHDGMSWEAGTVDEQLEGELQPGVHLPPPRLALAFFSSFLVIKELAAEFAYSTTDGDGSSSQIFGKANENVQ